MQTDAAYAAHPCSMRQEGAKSILQLPRECQIDSWNMEMAPAPRIRWRRTRRLICLCVAKLQPQSVAVDELVTDPPTEKDQVLPNGIRRDEVDDEHKQTSSSNKTLKLEQKQVDVNAETFTKRPKTGQRCMHSV